MFNWLLGKQKGDTAKIKNVEEAIDAVRWGHAEFATEDGELVAKVKVSYDAFIYRGKYICAPLQEPVSFVVSDKPVFVTIRSNSPFVEIKCGPPYEPREEEYVIYALPPLFI